MRDLLFKNLTSLDRRKKIIASSETVDKQGVRSTIRRHLVCMVRELKNECLQKPQTCLYVVKEKNTKEQRERFFCKIKGSLFVASKSKLYEIQFMHSLRIILSLLPQGENILP